jgi:hypothetical protein
MTKKKNNFKKRFVKLMLENNKRASSKNRHQEVINLKSLSTKKTIYVIIIKRAAEKKLKRVFNGWKVTVLLTCNILFSYNAI